MSPTSRTFRLNGIRFILCICIVLVSVDWIAASDPCEFPSEIQTLVPHHSPRSWHGQVRDQYTSFAFQMDVTGGVIRQTPSDSRAGPAPVTRRCVRLIGDDRYLVSIEDADGNRRGYACMRFLMRSADVVQVSASDVSGGADDGLCGDDALRSDKWLIVDKTRFGTHRIRCPLEGGFTLSVFDKLRQRGVCDAWNGEIRLESECSHNDGLVFLFRTQSCVPEGMMMYATQPTHCLAAWTEGSYTFTIVRHDFYLYAWLLRFPTDAPDSFSTYLFKDLFADTTHHVTENLNYLRMDTTRDRPRQPGDLCYDDYERCTHMTAPCSGGINPPNAALTCPLKCGMCARSSPVRCRLSPDWIGKWDSDGRSHNRSNSITINGTTMIVHSHHVAQHMHCVHWQEGSDSDESVMLVTEYTNGCRPRYTCARVGTVSPSQLNVTFGKTVTWPFVENRSEPLDCAATGFKPRRNEQEANISRSLLLHWRTAQHPVACHLPFRASSVEVSFRNGTTCSGGRLAETRGRRTIEFSLRGCSRSGIVGSYEFSCLESTRFQPDDDLLIIARTNSSADVFCLVFPFADDTTFHLIQGSDLCQSAVLRTADLDSLHLLRGTLSGIVPRSTAVPSTEAPSSSAATTSDAGTSASVTTGRAADLPIPDVTRSASDSTPPWAGEGNATVPPLIPRPTEHPVVVGFVAFLFAIVQTIIYFCNCF